MPIQSKSYNLFFNFIEKYTPYGFIGIDPEDQLLQEVEEMEKINNQFFYIADVIQMKVLYTSRRSTQMIGISPVDVSPYSFMDIVHPDDIQRLNYGRTLLIKLAQEHYIAEKGISIVSTNFKFKNAGGGYSDYLIQCYLFYTTIPYRTVFFLKIHTNIDWSKKLKCGYHYYVGNDLSYFRYPDEELLNMGNVFSKREFEIIKLIESGSSSEQIAEKLFLSLHTVNTHRKNILAKAGKTNISELIHDLIMRGVL